MHQPKKKAAAAPSGRAALTRSAASSMGLSAAMVRAQLHRPLPAPAPEAAYAAQQRRYQQITRSAKPLARPQPVAPQDGPLAYYAQARMRAELTYRAQTAHRLRIEQEAAAQYAANRQYIRQGSTPDERRRGRAAAVERQIAQNTRDMMQAQPEAAGIASGVGVGMAMASQVFGPQLAVTRLVGAARWLGAARTAVALERVGQGLSYRAGGLSGTLTWNGAKQAASVFGKRALLDGALQYTGAVVTKASLAQQEPGPTDVFGVAWSSFNEVSISSMAMSGLPGETMGHSFRNAAVANLVEWKWNTESVMSFKIARLGTGRDALNYAQKVGLSVGADYLAGRYSGRVQRAYDGTRLVRPIGSRFDPHAMAEWRQTRSLLQTLQLGQYPIKITGGVLSSVLEPHIVPPDSVASPQP